MGQVEDLEGEQLAIAKENMYATYVTMLTPLKNPEFQLSLLGDSKVGDRPAVGVKVSHKGHNDMSLYFDKEKGLLMKSQRRAKDPMSGNEMNLETVFSSYKDVEGVQRFMKMAVKRDGDDFLDIDTTEFKTLDNVDDNVFAKPGQ
jgi:hypothetical protein